ncbi:MAG: sensor histidine kinase [Terriglobales bacterium]
MNPINLPLFFYLTTGLALVCLLGIAIYAIHRLSRRSETAGRPGGPDSLPATWPTPPGVLVDMVARLKRQEVELEALRRDARHRDQDSLRVSRDLLSHLPSGVIFFDRLGVVQHANPAARAALGFASPQGLRASELFRSAEVQEPDGPVLGPAVALVQRALETGVALQRKEMEYRTPKGHARRLGLTFSPLTAAALGPGREREDGLGLICLLTDLTAIRALQTELQRRQSLASLGEMAAGIAHEFKNALATISGYAQLLAADLAAAPSPGEQPVYAVRIVEQTAALTQMVSEFLLFARPLDAHLEPVCLVPILAECVEEMRGLGWPNVEFELSITESDELLQVMADPLLLKRVWLNLLRNGAEAIAATSGPLPASGRVRVSVETDGRCARVRVMDTGAGVPPAVAEKIFIPFFTTKSSGSGLGLAVVYNIAAAHQGSVALEGGGAGAVFAVTLPLVQRADPAAAGHSAS